LSDVRVSNRNKNADIGGLRSALEKNPYSAYNLILHSTQNKRGVGILIKKSLCLSEINRAYDREENYLAISLRDTTGNVFICCAIYGPNSRDESFFTNLEQGLRSLGDHPIVMGGDWNCTYSDAIVDINIDCLNMANLPNNLHSQCLKVLCEHLDLIDPFRILWPNTKKYSYFPRNANQINRSRIDFFLVSANLIPIITHCDISSTPVSTAFDHATISLDFRNTNGKKNRKHCIFNSILSDPDIDIVFKLTVLETYMTHIVDNNLQVWRGRDLLTVVGECRTLLRNVGPTPSILPFEQISLESINRRNGAIAEITDILDSIDWNSIQTAENSCDQKTFIDVLVNNIVNELTSYQSFIGKKKLEYKTSLKQKLAEHSNSNRVDMDAIRDLERQLIRIQEQELNSELERYSIFDIVANEKITPAFLKLAKTGRSDASLTEVKNDDGVEFANDADRNRYITQYYRNVYSIPEARIGAPESTIEEFLGEHVINHRLVREKKYRYA